MESNAISLDGFYIENSIQEIVYDLLDSEDDGVDNFTLPLKSFIDTLLSNVYLSQTSLTSIYSLREALEVTSPETSAVVDTLYSTEDIQGDGFFAEGETNGGGFDFSLPIYQQLTVGAAPIEICSDNNVGEFNRLENRQWLRVNIEDSGFYTISMTRGPANTNWNASIDSDPDFRIFSQGRSVGVGFSGVSNSEVNTVQLFEGEHIIDAYDFFNIDINFNGGISTGGLTCFNISITEDG